MELTAKTKKGDIVYFIDDEDYDKIKHLTWYLLHTKYGKYYVKHDYQKKTKRKTIFLHRYIMDCPEGFVVDHKNGDTLDNRKSNLRICTQAQNMANCKKAINSKNRYRGVRKDHNRFQAYLKVDGKYKYFGSFLTEDQAAIRYNIIAAQYHGEFARLNNVMAFNGIK